MRTAFLALSGLCLLAVAVGAAEPTRISVQLLQDVKAPHFEDYGIPPEEPVISPIVDTTSTIVGKSYRTVLRGGIKAGPNYAGHYAVVVWGCGTSCSMFAVVNLRNGKVVTPKGINTVSGNYLDDTADKFMENGFHGYWGYRFRPDSGLLVLVGMLNEDEKREGAYYFVMKNDILELVYETNVTRQEAR